MMARVALAFGAGALFSVGLAISGMTDPRNVLAFLDVGGHFDPSLALVMIGAIGVFLPGQLLLRRARRQAVSGAPLTVPPRTPIDFRLVGGAALFGIGWGVSGYCPAPAITALGAGSLSALMLFVGMAAGTFTVEAVQSRIRGASSSTRYVTPSTRADAAEVTSDGRVGDGTTQARG